MEAHSCYECLVTFDAVALHAYAHRTLAPSFGSVQKLQKQHFPEDLSTDCFRGWQEVIIIRAVSKTEPPVHGQYQVVNGDALRSFVWRSYNFELHRRFITQSLN